MFQAHCRESVSAGLQKHLSPVYDEFFDLDRLFLAALHNPLNSEHRVASHSRRPPASRVLNCASDRMVPRAWRTAGQGVIGTFHKVSNLLFERHRAESGRLKGSKPACGYAYVWGRARQRSRVPAMIRSIGDFDVTWAGEFVQAKRKCRPRHVYEYNVSGDRRSIDKLYWTAQGLNDGPRMTPLSDLPRFEAAARAAAEEFLRLEQDYEAPPLRLVD
jgi:hypothetical protein